MSDFAQTVKQQADIVKVIEGYIRLRKAGAQRFTGLCPFHKEKTPSFSVHAGQQFFYCFGCQATGDVFSFVGKIENVGFPEAVRIVAQKCGIPLPKREFSSPEEAAGARLRTRLLDLHETAAAWFEEQLRSPGGALAREYLAGRGLSDEGIKKFRIGYAPDSYNALRDRLSGLADEATLRASGLFSSKEQGDGSQGPIYDRFRKRVMFPISNEGGRVIAFTARTLETGEKAGAKYINSPETPLYTKGQVLFNLDKAKAAIRALEFALLVEGQMDCISVFLAGIQNVIATSGTAFTEQQVAILKRHTQNVVVSFDPDIAGANATEKTLALLIEEGFKVKIVNRSFRDSGMDPDRFVREMGETEFRAAINTQDRGANSPKVRTDDELRQAIRGAQWYDDYMIERAKQLFPGNSTDQKVKAMNFLLPHIRRMPETLAREQFAADAAQKLGIGSAVLREELRQAALRRRERVEVRDSGLKRVDQILVRAVLAEDELRAEIAESLVQHPEWFEQLTSYPALCAMAGSADPMASLQDAGQREVVAGIVMQAGQVPAAPGRRTSSQLEEEQAPSLELVRGTIDGLHREWLELRHRNLIADIGEAEQQGDFQRAVQLGQEKLLVGRELTRIKLRR